VRLLGAEGAANDGGGEGEEAEAAEEEEAEGGEVSCTVAVDTVYTAGSGAVGLRVCCERMRSSRSASDMSFGSPDAKSLLIFFIMPDR